MIKVNIPQAFGINKDTTEEEMFCISRYNNAYNEKERIDAIHSMYDNYDDCGFADLIIDISLDIVNKDCPIDDLIHPI